jgi:hypothetical protein
MQITGTKKCEGAHPGVLKLACTCLLPDMNTIFLGRREYLRTDEVDARTG